MKKILAIILMLLLVLSLGLLSACGQEQPEDEPEQPAEPLENLEQEPEQAPELILDQDVSGLESKQDESLIGDWFISNTQLYGGNTDGYTRLSFSEDGSYVQYLLNEGKETTVTGTWTIATGQLTMIANERNVSYDYEVTADTLTLSSGGSSMVFSHTQPE